MVEFFVRIPRGYDFGGGGSGASDLVIYREQTGEWRILPEYGEAVAEADVVIFHQSVKVLIR